MTLSIGTVETLCRRAQARAIWAACMDETDLRAMGQTHWLYVLGDKDVAE